MGLPTCPGRSSPDYRPVPRGPLSSSIGRTGRHRRLPDGPREENPVVDSIDSIEFETREILDEPVPVGQRRGVAPADHGRTDEGREAVDEAGTLAVQTADGARRVTLAEFFGLPGQAP